MYNAAYAQSSIGSKHFVDLAKSQVEFLASELELPKGAKILDIPCGVGRHSLQFAKRGYNVTGLDISKDCIKIANKKFSHKNAVYRTGDMSRLHAHKGKYDCVLNMFTSFGYFRTDRENEMVLRQMVSALKPGGKFVLNLVDLDWLMTVFRPSAWRVDDGILSLEARIYDKNSRYIEARFAMIDLKRSKLLHNLYHRERLYSKPEIMKLLKNAGLKNISVFGDFDGGRFKKYRSTHPIYIGTKK